MLSIQQLRCLLLLQKNLSTFNHKGPIMVGVPHTVTSSCGKQIKWNFNIYLLCSRFSQITCYSSEVENGSTNSSWFVLWYEFGDLFFENKHDLKQLAIVCQLSFIHALSAIHTACNIGVDIFLPSSMPAITSCTKSFQ